MIGVADRSLAIQCPELVLLVPRGSEPFHLANDADGQAASGEPTSGVEERSPVKALVVI